MVRRLVRNNFPGVDLAPLTQSARRQEIRALLDYDAAH
jgi:hypothetical protein